MRPMHILVVEDDPVTRATLVAYFEEAGFRVYAAENGEGLWRSLERAPIDLVLLDVKLPGEDGFFLLRELRKTSEVAVIMVTAQKEEFDRILGLELGAHDYVTKPFNMRELLARAKNLIRLKRASRAAESDEGRAAFNGWRLDLHGRRLTAPSGADVPLTRAEFDLLATLVANAGKVMSRDSLLDHVSHRDWEPVDRTIDVLVGRVRRKIEDDPKQPRHLITVHGIGYLFAAADRGCRAES